MRVPFFSLYDHSQELKKELLEVFNEVLERSEFIFGQHVSDFENNFANYLGVNHCVGVSSGADALYVSLKVLGVGAGDEIITSAHSWISTADAIARTGAEPIFVDTNEFHLIDTSLIESKITSKTKAILPVHLYGQMADMEHLHKLAKQHQVAIVEDCAQAHGATFKGKKAGIWGTINAFSFYPTKNLGALGDAGAIVTDSAELAKKCRTFANNGLNSHKKPELIGINSRMDALQAAFLSLKLKKINHWNTRRQELAGIYLKELAHLDDIQLPKTQEHCSHVFHVFAIQTNKRDQLANYLASKEIATSLHYAYLLPFTNNYSYQQNSSNDFKNAIEQHRTLLSLPLYPELSNEQVYTVCKAICSFFKK